MAPAVPFDTLATGKRTSRPADYRIAIENNLEFFPKRSVETFPYDRESFPSSFSQIFDESQTPIAARLAA